MIMLRRRMQQIKHTRTILLNKMKSQTDTKIKMVIVYSAVQSQEAVSAYIT